MQQNILSYYLNFLKSNLEKEAILKFYDILKQNHVNVTIRRGMGKDIDAACGQLRKTYIESE